MFVASYLKTGIATLLPSVVPLIYVYTDCSLKSENYVLSSPVLISLLSAVVCTIDPASTMT